MSILSNSSTFMLGFQVCEIRVTILNSIVSSLAPPRRIMSIPSNFQTLVDSHLYRRFAMRYKRTRKLARSVNGTEGGCARSLRYRVMSPQTRAAAWTARKCGPPQPAEVAPGLSQAPHAASSESRSKSNQLAKITARAPACAAA